MMVEVLKDITGAVAGGTVAGILLVFGLLSLVVYFNRLNIALFIKHKLKLTADV